MPQTKNTRTTTRTAPRGRSRGRKKSGGKVTRRAFLVGAGAAAVGAGALWLSRKS